MGYEREDPHADIYKWVDEKEAELAADFVACAVHFCISH